MRTVTCPHCSKSFELSVAFESEYKEAITQQLLAKHKEELEKAKEEILKIREEIENSNFECNHGFLCQDCEFKMFCSAD